jgi:hypothetical protein
MSHEGVGNTNIRDEIHKMFGGTKGGSRCVRYKGLNEILVLTLL